MKSKYNPRMESELTVILDILTLWESKSKTYDEAQAYRFERILSNLLYDLKSTGFFCGLQSKGLVISKGKPPTHDHVYSRKLASDNLMKKHLKEPFTIDTLKEILPILLTTIILSSKDNKKLSLIVTKGNLTLEDVKKMKHYKKGNISLQYKNGNGHYEELVTEEMKELIGLDTKPNPFWD